MTQAKHLEVAVKGSNVWYEFPNSIVISFSGSRRDDVVSLLHGQLVAQVRGWMSVGFTYQAVKCDHLAPSFTEPGQVRLGGIDYRSILLCRLSGNCIKLNTGEV